MPASSTGAARTAPTNRQPIAARIARMSIARKLRLASLGNVAALVVMLLSIAIGGKVALDLRSQRMALSESSVAAAQFARSIHDIRFSVHELADGGGVKATDFAQEFSIARGHLEHIGQRTSTVAADLAPEVASLRAGLASLQAQVDLLASGSRTTSASAREILAAGENLTARADRLDMQLDNRGLATDALSRNRITILFAAFFAMFALAIAITLLTARFLARDISHVLGNITSAARAIAAGRSDIAVPGLDHADEIGELAQAIELARSSVHRIDELSAERRLCARSASTLSCNWPSASKTASAISSAG